MQKELRLIYKGRDNWERPVYEGADNGKLYVDVDPRKDSNPDICTKSGNNFYGEPDMPIGVDITPVFVLWRETW